MKKIGLVVAMVSEVMPFLEESSEDREELSIGLYKIYKFTENGNELYIIQSGVGEIFASSATQLLIDRFNVEVVLNFGVVGSLIPGTEIGQVAFMNGVVHYDYDTTPIDENLVVGQYPNEESPVIKIENKYTEYLKENYPSVPFVICASADKFVADRNIKNYLRDTYGASICDMESAAITMVCKNNSIPCLFIKAVSDNESFDFLEGVKIASKVYLGIIKDIIYKM